MPTVQCRRYRLCNRKEGASPDMTEIPKALAIDDPAEARRMIRANDYPNPTVGVAPGYVQCSLVMLPKPYADEFEEFCEANSEACPVVARTAPGARADERLGRDLDLAKDAGSYRLFRAGDAVSDVLDIESEWQSDFVTFAIGSANSIDGLLMKEGADLTFLARGDVPAHYITDCSAVSVGAYRGPLAATMRPIPSDIAEPLGGALAHWPKLHGAPISVGDPECLGIDSLEITVARNGLTTVQDDETPVFWASGLTAHLALSAARIPSCITTCPGYLLITDIDVDSFREDEPSEGMVFQPRDGGGDDDDKVVLDLN